MIIKRFIGGNLESNAYIIYQKDGADCYIIDPGYNPGKLAKFIRDNELNPLGIIITHNHYDHTGGADSLAGEFDVNVYMHEADAFDFDCRNLVELKDGEELFLGGEKLEIISTPGHTHGSICIMSSKSRVCFTGDTIFDTDLGRTDFDGGSEDEMRHTIREVISKWDNDIVIYPGHDSGCTMKKVKIYNSEYNDYLK